MINNARNLLNTLGYDSEMKIDLESNLAEDFISEFDPSRKLNRERAMVEEWETIDLLFQLTEKKSLTAKHLKKMIPATGKLIIPSLNHICSLL